MMEIYGTRFFPIVGNNTIEPVCRASLFEERVGSPQKRLITNNIYVNNKHLMTGPKENGEFCFPETLNVPRGEAKGNIEVDIDNLTLFCFVIPPNSK